MRKIAIFSQFGSILEAQDPPKSRPKPEKIDAKNVLFFNINFLGFRPRFWSLLGLQLEAKFGQNALPRFSRSSLSAFLS